MEGQAAVKNSKLQYGRLHLNLIFCSMQLKCMVREFITYHRCMLFVPLYQQETFAADILLLPLVGDEATDSYRITVSYMNTRLGEVPEKGWVKLCEPCYSYW